ncbi:hypothetical protein PG999_003177 [Apiospora kogelbergensis]|uniref:Heterokaryon incompatibility domain-containing protein n=1 Tax=Apiospora kogelbergensis TaxID=1337665 RepID=A0AAW0RA90_9PEZI
MPIDFSEVEFRSLVALLCRPWFTRLWIRQETFLANSHAIICCGDLRVFWTAFRNALALFHRKSKKSENPGPEKAARGRAFAVKGMLEDGVSGDLGVTPNYTKTYEEVYTTAVERSAAHFISLDSQCESSNSAAIATDNQKRFTRVFWTVATEIETTGPAIGLRWDQGLPEEIAILHAAISMLDTTVRPVHARNANFVQIYVHALQAGVRADRHHPPTQYDASAHDYIEVVQQLLAGTLSSDRAAANPGMSRVVSYYCEYLVGRRLGWDAADVPILCPGHAKPGDQVSLLVGCRFPMLLRPAGDKGYAVVGQCITRDTCDGEAMLGPLLRGTRVAKVAGAQWEFGYVAESTGYLSFLDLRLDDETLLGPDVDA